MKVVIERAKWVRGGKNGWSSLLNDKGCMCCLGFVAKAHGYEDKHLLGAGFTPRDGKTRWSGALSWLGGIGGECAEIAGINDVTGQDEDAVRERKLTARFAEHGIELEFV